MWPDGKQESPRHALVRDRDRPMGAVSRDLAAMQVADDPEPKQHPLERSADVEARRGVVHPRGVGPPVRTEVEAEEPLHLAQWRVDETW